MLHMHIHTASQVGKHASEHGVIGVEVANLLIQAAVLRTRYRVSHNISKLVR